MNCTTKYGLLSVFLASTFAVHSWAQDASKPTVAPMITAAYHVPTFQNENMVLESVTLPPGASTGYHLHDQDLFFAITGGAKVTNQVLGKDPVELELKLGQIVYSPYTKTPGTHRITNLEKEHAMRLLAVAFPQEPGQYKVSTRSSKYEVAMDNDRLRVWRLKLGPGESAPIIEQTAPGARMVVAGGTVVEKRPGKPDQPMVLKNHDFVTTAVEARGIENVGSSAVEFVEFELK
jgi:quercetin dioxygenase-like cupin family protein